jgi:hypothetical protein
LTTGIVSSKLEWEQEGGEGIFDTDIIYLLIRPAESLFRDWISCSHVLRVRQYYKVGQYSSPLRLTGMFKRRMWKA